MKKVIYLLCLAFVMSACDSMGKSEKTILEYVRSQTGSPQLEIEFSEVQIIKQTVGDSIRILQKKYEQKLNEQIKQAKQLENDLKKLEEALKSMSKKDMMYSFYSQHIEMNKRQLLQLNAKEITNGKYRYEGQDTSRVIATIVNCRMTSLVNPVLKAKQTKEGSFLLSPDEVVCFGQLK